MKLFIVLIGLYSACLKIALAGSLLGDFEETFICQEDITNELFPKYTPIMFLNKALLIPNEGLITLEINSKVDVDCGESNSIVECEKLKELFMKTK